MRSVIVFLALLLSFATINVYGDDEASCQKAEETARNCCLNPKSCMSNSELDSAARFEQLAHGRELASEKTKEELRDLKSDLNHAAMDNCHDAVKACKTSCSEVDVKLAQKCQHDSLRADMFKQQINSEILPQQTN